MAQGFRCMSCGVSYGAWFATCAACWTTNCIIPWGIRAVAASDNMIEITTAKAFAKQSWGTLDVPAYAGERSGHLRLGPGVLVVIYGFAGSGKSSMALRACDSLDGPGFVLSVEEILGPSLSERCLRLGCKREDLFLCSRATVDQLVVELNDKKILGLVVDSAQRAGFSARDLRHLLLTVPTLQVIFAVSQTNREGEIRGGEELIFESDVAIEVCELTWTLRKSRYQAEGGGAVLPAPAALESA